MSAVAKNAADDKLRQSLRRFAHTYPPPSTVVLISGDVNFSPELNDLRHIHNITITLVHNEHASEALRVFAHSLISYEKFLEDVEAPREAQVCGRKGRTATYLCMFLDKVPQRGGDGCIFECSLLRDTPASHTISSSPVDVGVCMTHLCTNSN